MQWNINEILTVSFTLFAIIDIIGSIPLLISIKSKAGGIHELRATLISGALMIIFLFFGQRFLGLLGVSIPEFAVAGSIVIFLLGLEMVLGHDFFKSDPKVTSGAFVPVAFPIIAGSGTLTTVMSLKASYENGIILIGILLNLFVIYGALHSLKYIEKVLGEAGLTAVRKFFGVILLAIAVKIFSANLALFGK